MRDSHPRPSENTATVQRYRDRSHAGRRLGEALLELAHQRPLVLALPAGGVPVAYEVAGRLGAPLDVFLVQALDVPGRRGLPVGAVASGGIRVVRQAVVAEQGVAPDVLATAAAEAQEALERRERRCRTGRPHPAVRGRTVILVGDSLAPGSSMALAGAAVRSLDPAELVAAVPVGDPDACEELRDSVDSVVCPLVPDPFHVGGAWYDDFPDVNDREVRKLLRRRAAASGRGT